MRKQTNKKNLMPLLKRVLGIMLREYKVQFCLVVALILGAALSSPVIKCKKTPRKKCRFVADEKGKR